MLYVLKSPMYLEDTKRHCFAIKVGFTEDFNKRFEQYKIHNPAIRVIKTYEDGTLDDETRVLKYLQAYNIYRNEWFKCCYEVLNFFEINDTIDKIRKTTSYITLWSSRARLKGHKLFFWPFIACIKKVIGYKINVNFLFKNFAEYCSRTEDSVLKYISYLYPDYFPMILQEYEYWLTLDPRLITFIDHLCDTSILLSARLRELCESQEFTENEKRDIARFTSEKFDKYYNLVGPLRCKSLRYDATLLRKEVENMMISRDVIASKVLSKFKPGYKKSNIDFKSELQEIYNDLGLNKTAKASDLGDYFNVKSIKVSDSSGKWIHGLELISIK